MTARAAARLPRQTPLPSTGRKRKPAAKADPRVTAVLADRDRFLAAGGRHGWQQELTRRRAARVARLRDRRLSGYPPAARRAA